jgi:uncharacterized membrane protein
VNMCVVVFAIGMACWFVEDEGFVVVVVVCLQGNEGGGQSV